MRRFSVSLLLPAMILSAFPVLRGADAAASPATSVSGATSAPTAAALMTPARQKELFDALDLTGDALKPVREAVAKGDYAAAQHAWAGYLRQRALPWNFDYRTPARKADFHNAIAERAVNGTLAGGNNVETLASWPDNNIDWFHNETKIHGPLDYEWQWQLCRMGFWTDMATAYRATGDERYPQAWAKQLASFVAECPVPAAAANDANSAWRTIDTGIRMFGSWPNAFFSFLPSPSVTDADLALYAVSCLEHGRYLRQFETTGNWLTMEMNGLYTVGSVFPEFKETKDWRAFAAKKLYEQEAVQFLPDGAQFELTTGYHNVALSNFAGLARTAKLMGRLDELAPGYVDRLEKAYAYDLYLMTPNRSLPMFNDSGHANVPAELKPALDFFPHRADFQWVVTDGKEGAPPATTSHYFDWAGFAAMRSGWGTEANYAAFRVGSIGYGHCHQDKLELLIWAYGKEVLYSSGGGGSYEMSKWRTYAVSTFDHNCLLVDGLPQLRQTTDRVANIPTAPVDARWQSTPAYDFASGVYRDGYGTVDNRLATQTRRVLFVKPDLFVVADTVVPHDQAAHTYQARWQLRPAQTHQDPVTGEVTTLAPNQPNLAVVPLSPQGLVVKAISAQTEPELMGWDLIPIHPRHVPATTVTHTKNGAGVQQFLTLFIPIRTGAAEPIKSVTPKGDTSALVILADGRTLAISASLDPAGPLSLVETLAGGAPGRHVTTK
jgi:hypothetical protein